MTEDERVVSEGLEAVNGPELLAKLATLPVSTWRYRWEPPSMRHLGPMAQDFMATFGLGDDETRIDMVDANGVLTVAIQALYRRIIALEDEVASLRERSHEPL